MHISAAWIVKNKPENGYSFANASRALRKCSSLRAAETWTRMRALSFGDNREPESDHHHPLSKSRADLRIDSASSPIMIEMIAFGERWQWKPSFASRCGLFAVRTKGSGFVLKTTPGPFSVQPQTQRRAGTLVASPSTKNKSSGRGFVQTGSVLEQEETEIREGGFFGKTPFPQFPPDRNEGSYNG